MRDGIYIVSNDLYANQLIALLNSLEANWPEHPSICVIPYDDQVERVREICNRYQVLFYADKQVLIRIDTFFTDLWINCSTAVEAWKSKNKTIPHRLGMHRRFLGCFEEGLFDRFIYLDTDIYVNKSLQIFLDLLDQYDVVAHDWQCTGPQHVFNVNSPKLPGILNGPLLDQIQCAGLIVTKKTVLTSEEWASLPKLAREDQEVLHPWGPDQTLWNYAFNKYRKRFVNLVRSWPQGKVTHDAQTYTKFVFKDGKIYEGGNEIYYFHHIGVPANEVNLVCAGKKPKHEFRYQDILLYFRYLREKDKCPRPEVFKFDE